MAKKIKIELTQKQAEMLGIVWCSCGHRPNNHFQWGKKSCAHCDCKKYTQEIHLPDESKIKKEYYDQGF